MCKTVRFILYGIRVGGGDISSHCKLKVVIDVILSPRLWGSYNEDVDKSHADLWMMGTGTGIAPYLAMLKRDSELLHTYQKIVFVHSVRRSPHLCYQREIAAHAQEFASFQYVPVVTREEKQEGKPGLFSRIPELIHTGRLCEYAEQEFSVDHSVVMLCGHPGMIKGTIGALAELGLTSIAVAHPVTLYPSDTSNYDCWQACLSPLAMHWLWAVRNRNVPRPRQSQRDIVSGSRCNQCGIQSCGGFGKTDGIIAPMDNVNSVFVEESMLSRSSPRFRTVVAHVVDPSAAKGTRFPEFA